MLKCYLRHVKQHIFGVEILQRSHTIEFCLGHFGKCSAYVFRWRRDGSNNNNLDLDLKRMLIIFKSILI